MQTPKKQQETQEKSGKRGTSQLLQGWQIRISTTSCNDIRASMIIHGSYYTIM
jgi:hypothetical protein